MASNDDYGFNEAKIVLPLNMFFRISNFKLVYNLLRRPDGTFNRHLAELLDLNAPTNATAVSGVFSLDFVIDRDSGQPDLSSHRCHVIIFFHAGSFAHSSANLFRPLTTLFTASSAGTSPASVAQLWSLSITAGHRNISTWRCPTRMAGQPYVGSMQKPRTMQLASKARRTVQLARRKAKRERNWMRGILR